jgi:hypothetical protein
LNGVTTAVYTPAEKRSRLALVEELALCGRKGTDPHAVAACLTTRGDISIAFSPATSILALTAALTAP